VAPSVGTPPFPVDVPRDVRRFLDVVGSAYARHDLPSVTATLSRDFLYQGMDRERFVRHLETSFLMERISELEIIPTSFALTGETAAVVAVAHTNLGVLPQAADVLPLVGGCEIVRRDDGWSLRGDQSRAPTGIYRHFRSVTASIEADDLELYRQLLAPALEVPKRPVIRLVATDYLETTPPLEPYRVIQVQLASRYGHDAGWYPLTLPETSWLPVEGGRTLGYPKYVADAIVLEGAGNRWTARCANAGNPVIELAMDFEPDPGRAGWFARQTQNPPWAMVRHALPPFRELPWFLIMGGPQANQHPAPFLVRGDAVITGRPWIREVFGRVRLSIVGDQPWVGLRREWTDVDGVLMEFKGRLNLGHRLLGGLGSP
jgi:hypothetical protein